MGAFADPSDVEARWRPLSADELVRAETLLGDVSDMVRERWPNVESYLGVSSLRRVVANVVKRAMVNPAGDGVSQQSQTTGPFSQSNTYANPDGALYFTKAEVGTLEGAQDGPKVRMGWLF